MVSSKGNPCLSSSRGKHRTVLFVIGFQTIVKNKSRVKSTVTLVVGNFAGASNDDADALIFNGRPDFVGEFMIRHDSERRAEGGELESGDFRKFGAVG